MEDSRVSPHLPAPSGYSPEHQIVLPYGGAFEYRTGRAAAFLDVNRILYVTGGRDFADRHVVRDVGHASIIITPRAGILEELCGSGSPEAHDAFRELSCPSSPSVLLLTHRLRSLRSKVPNPLAREEIVVQALSTSMKAVPPRSAPTRTVERTKQWLHAHLAEPISLDEVAGAMGVSPVYLTQEFTRSEGIPLYRYQLRLRLARSLTELPHCEDITALALDLGFSSHSHFGAVFKATFGLTPSQFRSATSERSSAVLEMAWPNARIPS